MPASVWSSEIQAVIDQARAAGSTPFPSPEDWRDVWIYFVLTDRFNNPAAPPCTLPWDGENDTFQGGTFKGIQEQLGYLKGLGVGAIWLSPVLKNCQFDPHSYHGYGIQDFLAIDPRFASDPEQARRNPAFVENELRQLIDAAHAQGIYVIFDIVLNHAGDVFAYEGDRGDVPWRDDGPYPIWWRDAAGQGRADWSSPPDNPPLDATVWPSELRRNEFFRRQGNAFTRPGNLNESAGDFFSLKELVTAYEEPNPVYGVYYPVRDALIRSYQYLIARYDVDGFRVDTLKYIEPDFARLFGNAIREFALSIGKRNFFTFGEVYDDEEKIAHFIGRNATDPDDLTGIDAALDFPLFFRLPGVAKGQLAPAEVVNMYERRHGVQKGLISSHGEASQYFVTFLDNHDQSQRFLYSDPSNPHQYDAQLTLGIGCLFTLQGIPCLFYGTEQGLHGAGNRPEAVREALWGKAGAQTFDRQQPFYRAIQQLTRVRDSQPALRYGRQYFRPISGDGVSFGVSPFPGGVLAFSRILNDEEVVVIANTNSGASWAGETIIDYALNPVGSRFQAVFSNRRDLPDIPTTGVIEKPSGRVRIQEVNGAVTSGPSRVIHVDLQPMEILILASPR